MPAPVRASRWIETSIGKRIASKKHRRYMTTTKNVYVIAGGTVAHIAPHLALSAPAYGKVGWALWKTLDEFNHGAYTPKLVLTRMAAGNFEGAPETAETNEDVAQVIDTLVADLDTKMIFLAAALCDFEPLAVQRVDDHGFEVPLTIEGVATGKTSHPRLVSSAIHSVVFQPAEKIVNRVRKERKDIFLVAFKTTAGATPDEQYFTGLKLLKNASCNLVLANDVKTRLNMVITPEQARYHETTDRDIALTGLVEMALARSEGTFTRSTVVPGDPVPWSSPLVPASLRAVVDHCIARGAYKPFNDVTVGHFAVKLNETSILTSRRKTNFNELAKIGLVKVDYVGEDAVIAHGFKPSVGGQSQRRVFLDHPDVDCIVHMHVPPRSEFVSRPQRDHECGSHQCGQNTSSGLQEFTDGIKAVMLDQHGPNIVFNRSTDPNAVIAFIERYFDLEGRTDGVA